ncbi:hypothetical protein Ait01nite_070650 [Actinoplanes italicus]|uniref:Uncharacterized protein n=1 Tax=Actinoplanes italicus TaxID=113567 RepID=A0A2T0JVH4_9ACTN|nr:hypothetical protein [Actinoplanes italicus]PRX11453.1 hypothetical protein CLV67_13129 [Actinoplanes italicus]GIE34020.1 hypothetical protein Ait01nite_070650 [Actinoplanes italicus]
MEVVAPGRHRRPAPLTWQLAAVVLCWLTVLAVSGRQRISPVVHDVALLLHLGSVVAGFGAVLMVDWFGLLWLAGRRTFADVLRTAHGAHVPTWLGFAGLLASGALLGLPAGPKAIAVLVVGVNGVYAGALLRELSRWTVPPTPLLIRSGLATLISQGAWWTAVVLGHLTSRGG